MIYVMLSARLKEIAVFWPTIHLWWAFKILDIFVSQSEDNLYSGPKVQFLFSAPPFSLLRTPFFSSPQPLFLFSAPPISLLCTPYFRHCMLYPRDVLLRAPRCAALTREPRQNPHIAASIYPVQDARLDAAAVLELQLK